MKHLTSPRRWNYLLSKQHPMRTFASVTLGGVLSGSKTTVHPHKPSTLCVWTGLQCAPRKMKVLTSQNQISVTVRGIYSYGLFWQRCISLFLCWSRPLQATSWGPYQQLRG
ncbi:hypothetical protein FKM82_014210 [Ascaphus truei]